MRAKRCGGVALAGLAAWLIGAGGETAQALPPDRGWELVSPADKGGGSISLPTLAPAGAFKAAEGGGAVAYASADAFADPLGASPFNNYIATRSSSGWVTENLTPAQLSGAYESSPYLAFSEDLARGLLLNPSRCPDGSPCPQGVRLIDLDAGTVIASLDDDGEFQGASDDLGNIVLRKGSDLYLWAPLAPPTWLGGTFGKVNFDPADSLAAREDAVSPDAAFIYFKGEDGNLHLRVAPSAVVQIDAAQGGGGVFEAASDDGQVAFFSKGDDLYRYVFPGSVTKVSASTGFTSFLGSDADGQVAYFRSGNAIFRWILGGAPVQILTKAGLSDTAPKTSATTDSGDVLFLTTAAPLLAGDSNSGLDVYMWSRQGTASCASSPGCVDLISPAVSGPSVLAGVSASGGDAYFTTETSLVWNDRGETDLYGARVGGGFPAPQPPVVCEGDACQGIVLPLDDPVPGSAQGTGSANPSPHYRRYGRQTRRCPRGKRLRTIRKKNGRSVKRCVKRRKRDRGHRRARKRKRVRQ